MHTHSAPASLRDVATGIDWRWRPQRAVPPLDERACQVPLGLMIAVYRLLVNRPRTAGWDFVRRTVPHPQPARASGASSWRTRAARKAAAVAPSTMR